MACNKFIVQMKECLVFLLPHWLLLLNLLCWILFIFLSPGLLRTLFLDLASFYSHILDDSFQFSWLSIPSICYWFPNLYLQPRPLSWTPDISNCLTDTFLGCLTDSSKLTRPKWDSWPSPAKPSQSYLMATLSFQLLHPQNLKSDPWLLSFSHGPHVVQEIL